MPDREKVIKGLEHCLADEWQTCTGCPYNSGYTYDDPHSGCQGSEEPMRDAIALLKEQEPRVMTLEEALNSLAIEYRGGELQEVGKLIFNGGYEYYGNLWRVWDRMPTDEQRKAVKWGQIT